jgi:hypothetical protein
MRLAGVFCLMVALIGICAGQDTNFPVGPQYLITNSSSYLLRPIATPTLSFTPPVLAYSSAEGEASGSEEVVYTPPRVPAAEVSDIHKSASDVGENAGELVSETGTTEEEASPLPAGVINVGVAEIIDLSALPDSRYGMPLAQVAAFWKAHKTTISHVYTNADIARLHGG